MVKRGEDWRPLSAERRKQLDERYAEDRPQPGAGPAPKPIAVVSASPRPIVTDSPSSDEELIRRAARCTCTQAEEFCISCHDVFGVLYKRYRNALKTWLVRDRKTKHRIKDRGIDVLEIVYATFGWCAENRLNWDDSKKTFKVWLFGQARNVLRDRVRAIDREAIENGTGRSDGPNLGDRLWPGCRSCGCDPFEPRPTGYNRRKKTAGTRASGVGNKIPGEDFYCATRSAFLVRVFNCSGVHVVFSDRVQRVNVCDEHWLRRWLRYKPGNGSFHPHGNGPKLEDRGHTCDVELSDECCVKRSGREVGLSHSVISGGEVTPLQKLVAQEDTEQILARARERFGENCAEAVAYLLERPGTPIGELSAYVGMPRTTLASQLSALRDDADLSGLAEDYGEGSRIRIDETQKHLARANGSSGQDLRLDKPENLTGPKRISQHHSSEVSEI